MSALLVVTCSTSADAVHTTAGDRSREIVVTPTTIRRGSQRGVPPVTHTKMPAMRAECLRTVIQLRRIQQKAKRVAETTRQRVAETTETVRAIRDEQERQNLR